MWLVSIFVHCEGSQYAYVCLSQKFQQTLAVKQGEIPPLLERAQLLSQADMILPLHRLLTEVEDKCKIRKQFLSQFHVLLEFDAAINALLFNNYWRRRWGCCIQVKYCILQESFSNAWHKALFCSFSWVPKFALHMYSFCMGEGARPLNLYHTHSMGYRNTYCLALLCRGPDWSLAGIPWQSSNSNGWDQWDAGEAVWCDC